MDKKIIRPTQKVQEEGNNGGVKRRKKPEEIVIPEELQIKTLSLWRELYQKNRFDCEIEFYRDLKEELNRLEYFEMINYVDEQLLIVKEIKRLSDEYSRCVNEDEEEEIRGVIKDIQKKISSIKKEDTVKVALFCLERNGKSLSAEIYQETVSRHP